MTADPALDDLCHACRGSARVASDSDAVAGVAARYVASPSTSDEVAQSLRVAARHGLHVVPRGGGSAIHWGGAPQQLDLILDMRSVAGIVEHAAGDLVVVARAGTPYHDLQETVAGAGQRLALDGALPGATLGGLVATGASGPRRLLYGTMRDLLIGVRFVRADGVAAKAGGKVVKNVAGYDFGKLLTGSFGTLAVITEVALRLHPQPAESRYVTTTASTPDDAGRLVAAVLDSQTVPAAVEVDQPATGPITVAVLLEGTVAGVTSRVEAVKHLLGDAVADEKPPPWFGTFPFSDARVGLKITTVISGIASLLAAVGSLSQRHGVAIDVRGSAVGVLYAGLDADAATGSSLPAILADLRAAAAEHGGHVVVLTAPDELRPTVDVWGPTPGLLLMRRVKAELDPGRLLSPGRFVGGI